MRITTKKIFTVISVSLVAFGCGLDDRPHAEPQPTNTPTISNPKNPNPVVTLPKKDGPILKLYWDDTSSPSGSVSLKRALEKADGNPNTYRADAAFTVPWYTPRDIEVTVDRMPALTKAPIQVSAVSFPKKPYENFELRIESWSIRAGEGKDGLSSVRAVVSGFSALIGMTTAREEVLNVTLEFAQEQQRKFSVSFVVMTPPHNVNVNQRSLNDYESAAHTLPDEWKYLVNEKAELRLIQVLEVQSLSSRDIIVDLPTIRRGKLSQRSVWSHPQAGTAAKDRCDEDPQTIEVIEAYSSKFALIPLNEKLTEDWASAVARPSNTIEISPKQTQLVGVYALPNKPYEGKFKTLLSERSPKEYARTHPVEMITYPVACNFTCDSLDNTEAYRTQCNSIPQGGSRSACDGRVAACTGCMTLRADSGKQEKCNQCFREESFSFSFKGPYACVSGWKREPTKTKQAKKGTDMGPILLEIMREDTTAKAYYGDQPRESESVPGSINLLRETVVQDQ